MKKFAEMVQLALSAEGAPAGRLDDILEKCSKNIRKLSITETGWAAPEHQVTGLTQFRLPADFVPGNTYRVMWEGYDVWLHNIVIAKTKQPGARSKKLALMEITSDYYGLLAYVE